MSNSTRTKATSTAKELKETEEIEPVASVDERSESAADAAPEPGLPTRDQLVDEINQIYAYMEDVGAVLHEHHDPDTGNWTYRLISVKQFKNNVANIPFTDNPEEGTRAKQETGTAWLRHPSRRSYHCQIFRPKGLTPDEELVYFNTFTGFGFDPLPGDCDLFWQHVHDNIAQSDAQLTLWIRAWLAALIQHPELRASVALVLRGERGTGKGVFAQTIGKLLGQHFLHLTSPDVLTGRFNRILQNMPIVYADESFWAGDKKAESRLKTLITEDRIIVEEKYIPAYTVPNVMHLVIAGNDDWVVPAGRNERRFAVFNMSNVHMQDRVYFKAVFDQMENGGYEALLYELQNFDLDACGVDPHVAPVTDALAEQQVLSMSAVEQFWYECLEEGRAIDFHEEWGEEINGNHCIGTDLLYQRYVERTSMARTHRAGGQQSFSKIIKKLMPPSTRTERRSVQISEYYGGNIPRKLMRCFVVPSLGQCRAHFEKAFPKITWDVPAPALVRDANGMLPPKPRASVCPGATPLPEVRKHGLASVVDEFDDLIEHDWDSDEPCVIGEPDDLIEYPWESDEPNVDAYGNLIKHDGESDEPCAMGSCEP